MASHTMTGPTASGEPTVHQVRRALVTGAGGMLGSAILPALRDAGVEAIGTDIKPGWPRLDVRNLDQVRAAVASTAPDVIVHLAAETSLERCERDPRHANATNTAGTTHVARAAAEAGVPLVHVSTAGVFDGNQYGPYDESEQPDPINEYGRSKLAGEEHVQRLCDRYLIVRAGWMMGGGTLDHKFVGAVCRQLEAGAETVYAVGDKFGSPTYAVDFASCLLGLLAAGPPNGVYHMASGGAPRRVDVAARILQVLGEADRVRLVTVDSEFFRHEFPVARPRSEALRNAALDALGLNTMRRWDEALADYLCGSFGNLVRERVGGGVR
jgi:dTDP-4-dehydrorhamnose reductase